MAGHRSRIAVGDDVVTYRAPRRRRQTVMMLAAVLIPSVIVVVNTVVTLNSAVKHKMQAERTEDMIRLSLITGDLVDALENERSYVGMRMISIRANFTQDTRDMVDYNLNTAIERTDAVLNKMTSWPATNSSYTKQLFIASLYEHRQLQHDDNFEFREEVEFYTETGEMFINDITLLLISSGVENMWRWLQAYQTMHYTKDRTGIIQVLGSKILAFGAVTQDELTWLVQLEFERDLMFDDSNKYMDERHEVYPEQHFDVYQIFNNIDTMSAEIHKNDLPEPSEISSLYWFGNHSLEVEVFDDIHVHIAHDILEILESNIQKEYTQFVYSIICIALVIVFCPILFVWYARSLNEMMQEIRTYTIRLNAEKLRAEKLLYQMLPPTVAEQLKLGKQVRGESYEEVTIYFSDICGFTEMSAAANSPWDIVDLLDTLYTTFDNQIEKYDVYKVETIGDAYMVVSGLPSRNGSKHFSEMADMSLKLVSLAKEIVIPHQPDRCLKLRIGLHTGPCVAGVVGQKMPRYCLFGDTVNTAARMESTGEPLRIHISEATKRGLVPIGNYVISRRGDLQIKGKGVMETFWLEGWTETFYQQTENALTLLQSFY